jgi:transglutaminase-like putative cysteine protease
MNNYLKSSYFFDYTADTIQNLVSDFRNPSISDKVKAIDLYSKIRDQWTYDPYTISFHKEHFRASYIAAKPNGNCVEKSILLIACFRALNLPARLHLGKVKNHIAVERLTQKFGSNELAPMAW